MMTTRSCFHFLCSMHECEDGPPSLCSLLSPSATARTVHFLAKAQSPHQSDARYGYDRLRRPFHLQSYSCTYGITGSHHRPTVALRGTMTEASHEIFSKLRVTHGDTSTLNCPSFVPVITLQLAFKPQTLFANSEFLPSRLFTDTRAHVPRRGDRH